MFQFSSFFSSRFNVWNTRNYVGDRNKNISTFVKERKKNITSIKALSLINIARIFEVSESPVKCKKQTLWGYSLWFLCVTGWCDGDQNNRNSFIFSQSIGYSTQEGSKTSVTTSYNLYDFRNIFKAIYYWFIISWSSAVNINTLTVERLQRGTSCSCACSFRQKLIWKVRQMFWRRMNSFIHIMKLPWCEKC